MVESVNGLGSGVTPTGNSPQVTRHPIQRGISETPDQMERAGGTLPPTFTTKVKDVLLFFPRLLNFTVRLLFYILKWAIFPHRPQPAPARKDPPQQVPQPQAPIQPVPVEDPGTRQRTRLEGFLGERDLNAEQLANLDNVRAAIGITIFTDEDLDGCLAAIVTPEPQQIPQNDPVADGLIAPLENMLAEQTRGRVLTERQQEAINALRDRFGRDIFSWQDLQPLLNAILAGGEQRVEEIPQEVRQRSDEQRQRGERYDALIAELSPEVREYNKEYVETTKNQFVSGLNRDEGDWEALPGELISRYEEHQNEQAAAALLSQFDEIVEEQLTREEIIAKSQVIEATKEGVQKGTVDRERLNQVLSEIKKASQQAQEEQRAAQLAALEEQLTEFKQKSTKDLKTFVRNANLLDRKAIRAVPSGIQTFIAKCAKLVLAMPTEVVYETDEIRITFESLPDELPDFNVRELEMKRDGNTLTIRKVPTVV
ncbi:MAG: hypothetical protein SNF33_04055 [Candidatus Algichlamydia australiensis]|nr:hypothetical protein [Chlamydiales bacterium]